MTTPNTSRMLPRLHTLTQTALSWPQQCRHACQDKLKWPCASTRFPLSHLDIRQELYHCPQAQDWCNQMYAFWLIILREFKGLVRLQNLRQNLWQNLEISVRNKLYVFCIALFVFCEYGTHIRPPKIWSSKLASFFLFLFLSRTLFSSAQRCWRCGWGGL